MGGMTQAVGAALIRFAQVNGTTANTSIACADAAGNNIGANDTIIACIEQTQTNYTTNNRTSTTSVYADGYIRCSVDTSNDVLLVFWMAQESAADQQASPAFGFALVNGASANTSIAVADKDGNAIDASDALIAVIEKATVTGAPTDRTGTSTIYADGYVRCSVDTSSDYLIVAWISRTAARAHDSVCIKFTLAIMGLSDESDVTVTGIATEDEVLLALALDETSGLPLDEVAAEVTITAADTIRIDQVSPTVTAGAQIWVLWLDKSA
jgi:hypothetical protein